jgi:transposase
MMPGDDVLTMPVAGRVEVFTGSARRRRWSAQDKARIVAESHATSVGEVSDRYGICKTQLFTWRRDARRSAVAGVTFASVVADEAAADHAVTGSGLIEVELGAARVRVGRGADVGMAVAVIGALRGQR